jgi:undecaprenyl-diphosphatase
MPFALAVLLGVVEGLTEFLPVSSTGHLVLASHFLGLPDDDPATKSFEIVIQLGAILAVFAHYRVLLVERARGLFAGDSVAVRLFLAIAIAFAPAAVVGLHFAKNIKEHLLRPLPVAAALVVGGVLMIVVERIRARRVSTLGRERAAGDEGLDKVTPGRALAIGIGQCVSLWPGSSRSMCTIVSAQLAGLSTATAAEFSFLLALPTLIAATLYEGFKARHVLAAEHAGASVAAGLVVSFLVAWAVIASFLRYLRKHGLEPFGWYRIVVGVVVVWAIGR